MAMFQFGEDVPGFPVRVLNEREARAAAGIMFACGLAMFVYSLQTMDFRYAVLVVGGLTAQAALEGPPAATPAPAASTDAGAWAPVLADVDAIGAALAQDQVAGVAERAERIARALEALPDAPPAAAPVARAARDLHALGDAPLAAVRSAFGELMRALIGKLIAEPRLQAGYFLFECPMATTYPRWVQRSPTMANPYMGSRMLMCGAAISPWRVGGS